MPTEFVAQNGATLKQSTKIAVTNCPKAKKAKRARKEENHEQGRRVIQAMGGRANDHPSSPHQTPDHAHPPRDRGDHGRDARRQSTGVRTGDTSRRSSSRSQTTSRAVWESPKNTRKGVAVDNDPTSSEYGDVYVAEDGAHRVLVLSESGAFVEMFGTEVNEKTKGNVCTAASHEHVPVRCGRCGPRPVLRARKVSRSTLPAAMCTSRNTFLPKLGIWAAGAGVHR